MTRIVFVTLTLGKAGAERVTSLLINDWVKKGIQVTVIQTDSEDLSENYPMEDNISYRFVHARARFMPIRRIEEAIKVSKLLKEDPEAIGVAFVRRSILTLGMATLFAHNKFIVSERNDPRSVPKGRFAKKVRNWVFGRADACVFQTDEARSYFPQSVQEKGAVIVNPINSGLPAINEGEREKRIIAASRLSPQKNLPMLVRAFARIAADFPEYRLDIFGEGTEKEAVQKVIDEQGMSGRIFLKGFSKDIYQEMNRSAMFVSSSDYEGISNSMLEALAMGLPSVVTDCPAGGARMVIKNGVNGILVHVNDEAEMAKAIAAVLSDGELAARLSQNARAVREEYSIDGISNKWIEILESVRQKQ